MMTKYLKYQFSKLKFLLIIWFLFSIFVIFILFININKSAKDMGPFVVMPFYFLSFAGGPSITYLQDRYFIHTIPFDKKKLLKADYIFGIIISCKMSFGSVLMVIFFSKNITFNLFNTISIILTMFLPFFIFLNYSIMTTYSKYRGNNPVYKKRTFQTILETLFLIGSIVGFAFSINYLSITIKISFYLSLFLITYNLFIIFYNASLAKKRLFSLNI